MSPLCLRYRGSSCRLCLVFTRIEVETAIVSETQKDDITFANNSGEGDEPNIRVYSGDIVVERRTAYNRKAEGWKMMSDIGGTLCKHVNMALINFKHPTAALYIGFTLMSLLEVIAFVSVRKVRRDAIAVN